jgi:hypothetical protein
MAEEISVKADPTPDPTPEEAARLRLELGRSIERYEAAGLEAELKLAKARLKDLPAEETVVEEEEAEVDFGTGKYEDRTVAQLKALAESKGLPTSGTKDDLIATLREG